MRVYRFSFRILCCTLFHAQISPTNSLKKCDLVSNLIYHPKPPLRDLGINFSSKYTPPKARNKANEFSR